MSNDREITTVVFPGIGNLVWVVAWFWLVADSPESHKSISERERIYITNSIGKGVVKKVQSSAHST